MSKLTRPELLAEGATSTGDRWLLALREALRQEGRAAAGGWPGTVGEARARVEAYLVAELGRRKMLSLTREELDSATRTAYARAKRGWLSTCEPEAPEPRGRARALRERSGGT